MKKLIYNQKTKQFYVSPVLLDPNNWEESYIEMLKEAEAQCEAISVSRNFSKRSRPINFVVSRDAEVQYFIFHQIRYSANWLGQYLGNDYSVKNYLKDMSRSAVKNIQKFCDELIQSASISGAKIYKKYSIGRYVTYKARVDNFNRFMYKPKMDNNEIEIFTCMFHYDDEITREKCDSDLEFRAKNKLMKIYNSLISDISINPVKLSDYIEKKQCEPR